jgi:multidrug efflux pump subunit AcrA (membrane-fusion protein)
VIWSELPEIVIPLVSVLRISGQHFVYVAEAADKGLVAKLRSVTLGPIVGSEYVVLTGLTAGERLIVSGIQKIGDGAPVQDAATMQPPGPPPAGAGRGGRP